MIYDYLLVVLKLLVGFMTNKTLILAATVGIGIYFIWICFAILFSFGRKFCRRCDKLTTFVKASEKSEENLNLINEKAKHISVGLGRGVDTFRKNGAGFPSTYISKTEALDSVVNGGIFNHGKSLMKTFINVTTVFIFVLNVAYFVADKTITGTLLAQCFILPIVYFVICKLFYFIYASVQQKYYKFDVESFNDFIEAFDEKYGERIEYGKVVVTSEAQSEVENTNDVAALENVEVSPSQEVSIGDNEEAQVANAQLEEEVAAEEEPKDPIKTLDDYDFFKKKNIDVDKLMEEIPQSSGSLPYIDVDSDYVIKDDENAANSYHPNAQNGSEVLGGMLHDMNAVKKEKEDSENVPSDVKEVDKNQEDKTEEPKKAEDKQSESQLEDVFSGLGDFEVDNSKQSDNEGVIENIQAEESLKEVSADETDTTPSVSHDEVSGSEKSFESSNNNESALGEETSTQTESTEESIESDESQTVNETISAPAEAEYEVEEKPQNDIASIVGKFKPKSKLASGGVVIERNTKDNVQKQTKARDVKVLETNNDADDVVSSFKNSTNAGYGDAQNYYNNGGFGGQMNNGAPMTPYYNQGVYGQPAGFGGGNMSAFINNGFNGYNNGYGYPAGNGFNNGFDSQGNFYGNFNGVEQNNQLNEDYEQEAEEVVQDAPASKPKVTKSAAKPRAKVKNVETESPVVAEDKGRRGRPAKQIFDENVEIKDDAEFERVLSRAEKLMRKSEEGLSQSQAKRVEKELKTLLDAMSRYKEGV